MTHYMIDYGDLAKWEVQNDAVLLDFVDGCLLDNRLYATKRGKVAILETYLNCWSSCCTLYFSKDDEAEDLFYNTIEREETA